jgi:hypothetical protein
VQGAAVAALQATTGDGGRTVQQARGLGPLTDEREVVFPYKQPVAVGEAAAPAELLGALTAQQLRDEEKAGLILGSSARKEALLPGPSAL